MSKKNGMNPPAYGSPPAAPPSYAQAVGGVQPTSPYIQNQTIRRGPHIITTVVPVIGPDNTHMICPQCQAEINTSTKSEPSNIAWFVGFICCIVGCVFGCCLIPCCMKSCRDVSHSCPNCGAVVGNYRAYQRPIMI